MEHHPKSIEIHLKTLFRNGSINTDYTNDDLFLTATAEGKHGHERYGADGIVFHKDTIILISSMIIMIIVGKSHLCYMNSFYWC